LRRLEKGEVLTAKGAPVTNFIVVLSGHLAMFVDRGAGRHKLMEWRAGDVTGMLPYSRLVSPPGDSVAQVASEVLAVPREDLVEMIRECPELTTILVHTMLDRARAFTSSGLQDEKMVSLGKLAAGLAHELNNPVAAIERSAALLEDRLDHVEHATRALSATHLTEAQLDAIDSISASCLAARVHHVLSPIQQAEREDAIAVWLSDHGVDSSVAGPLAETSVTIAALDRVASTVSGPPLSAALQWVAANSSVRGITEEIHDAAQRISGLVSAIKGFTHMDQASVAEPVDLKSSLSNTVAVLNSKARSRSVAVTVTLEPGLPRVRGFVGELNQIWSNLIDNALDAVPEAGQVEISAARDRDIVVVRVVDNGPGIPAEIRQHMYEPFFTTKPVGKGTGLGLDIVRRLVIHNDAEIEVDTAPGRTEFRVSLPVADGDGGIQST
jgi:signal transduction histidine kinase